MNFWKDKGSWNDTLVQVCIIFGMAFGGGFGYCLWGGKGIIFSLAGIPIGFIVGIGIAILLCKYATDNSSPEELTQVRKTEDHEDINSLEN